MPRYGGWRKTHYHKLRDSHFIHEEAHELSRLRRMDYKEIKPMRRERLKLWEGFDKEATGKGWGKWRKHKEWRLLIQDWYAAKAYMSKKEKIGGWTFAENLWKDVWFWFDTVSQTLPEENRYSNDQSSKRKKGDGPHEKRVKAKREAAQAHNQSWIDGLMRTAGSQPERDKQLTEQAQRLGFQGKSLYRTALKRGYA